MIFIEKIIQKDRNHFVIQWTDGKVGSYKLSQLQKMCNCAHCRDEKTGDMKVDPGQIDPEVSAYRITNIGRYALKIEFSSGCSKGIYSFSELYRMMDHA